MGYVGPPIADSPKVRTSDQKFRATDFVTTGGLFLIAMLAPSLSREGRPAQWAWGISGGAVLLMAALALRTSRRARFDTVMGVVAVSLVLAVPLLLWLAGARMQVAATVLAVPLVLTVLFFDRFFEPTL